MIEHPVRPGWKLAPGVTPAETSPAAYRFRVTVDPRKEVALDVNEIRLGDSTIAVSDLSEEQLVFWRQSGIEVAKLEQILRPLLDKKADVERREQRLGQLGQTRQSIVADQQRLRENMKALRGSDEERQLLRRYTTQLNEQEDRLAALEREIATETAAFEKAKQELSAVINALSFDVAVPTAR